MRIFKNLLSRSPLAKKILKISKLSSTFACSGSLIIWKGKDIFVHRSEIPDGVYLNEEDPVEYETEDTEKGTQAKNVKKL